MESFEDIFDKILQICEDTDNSKLQDVLYRLIDEEGFNEDEKKFVIETFNLLDASADKYEDLQKSKDEGVGRQEWLGKQFKEMLDGRTEEEVEQVMSAINEASVNEVNRELTEEDE